MAENELIGRRLGAFVIDEPLGKGGMGAVYRGRDLALDRAVAIKTLAPHLQEDAEYVERFVREARVAAKLNHPNVVQIYGAGSEGGVAYMALELVPGCSLLELFKTNQPFPLEVACRLVRDSAQGLVAAHALDIIHRDLKPENILVTPDGQPKLADFGLAYSKSGQRITTSGVFLGTPQYSSPEQCNAEALTFATDLYSLGVVLYELVSGHPPYEAPTPLSLFKKILTDPIPSLEPEREDVPPSLRALVSRLLEKDPSARYGSAEELVRDLDMILKGMPASAPEGFRWPSERIQLSLKEIAGAATVADNATESVVLIGSDTAATNAAGSDTPAAVNGEDDTATVALPSGWRETGGPPPKAGAPKRSRAPLALAAIVAILAAAIAFTSMVGERGPVRVAVLGWTKGKADEEFEWLADAIPEFIRSELEGRPGEIELVASEQNCDATISGTFFAFGNDVRVTSKIQPKVGKWRGGETITFPKDAVLERLAAHAVELRGELRNVAAPARPSAPPAAPLSAPSAGPTADLAKVGGRSKRSRNLVAERTAPRRPSAAAADRDDGASSVTGLRPPEAPSGIVEEGIQKEEDQLPEDKPARPQSKWGPEKNNEVTAKAKAPPEADSVGTSGDPSERQAAAAPREEPKFQDPAAAALLKELRAAKGTWALGKLLPRVAECDDAQVQAEAKRLIESSERRVILGRTYRRVCEKQKRQRNR